MSHEPDRGSDPRVRLAVEDDVAAIKAMRDAFYSQHPPPPWRDESWEAHQTDVVNVVHGGGAFLAEIRDDPVGYALAWPEGIDAVKLGDLYVRPHDRGRGVGRALVRAVAEFARARGAAYVHLTANLEALRFYDRLPFAEESRNLAAPVGKLLER